MQVLALALVLTVAACGDDASPDGVAEPSSTAVVHAAGETGVPTDPERVVALDAGTTLPTLLDVGAPVVAAPLPDEYPTGLFAEGSLDGIESVGFPDPSLEAILAVEPDLIVGLDFPDLLDAYDERSAIAPTVLVEGTLTDWKVQARALADAVGRGEQFDGQLATYEADVAALAARLGDPGTIEVSVIRSLGDGFRIHTRFHFAGQVIDELGLGRPPSHHTDDPDERYVQYSLERLDLADADVLYVFARGSPGSADAGEGIEENIEEDLADLRASGLWDNLRAVRSGAVHVVDPLAWQQGGLPAAEQILADLRRTLTTDAASG